MQPGGHCTNIHKVQQDEQWEGKETAHSQRENSKYSAKFKSNYNMETGILMKNESFIKLS